jgi:hypothetical protein
VNTSIDGGESAILERAITADNESWSPEAARAILAFKLADADLRRADELAAKARSGSMTDEERQNLENYLPVGRLVEFMKAKALLSLKSQVAAA